MRHVIFLITVFTDTVVLWHCNDSPRVILQLSDKTRQVGFVLVFAERMARIHILGVLLSENATGHKLCLFSPGVMTSVGKSKQHKQSSPVVQSCNIV